MPRYCLAQINATVGDLEGNAERILRAQQEAVAKKADLVIYPELALSGYPPEDLLLKPRFIERSVEIFRDLAAALPGRALIGLPWRDANGRLRNAAVLINDGREQEFYYKCLLPNYAVFDEQRYFVAGEVATVFALQQADIGCGHVIGITICEDAWHDRGPAYDEAAAGAQVVACLSASPYHRAKYKTRVEAFGRLCRDLKVWFLYANLVGGQDELVFDGASMVLDPSGMVAALAAEFAEDLLFYDIPPLPPRLVGVENRASDRGYRRCICACSRSLMADEGKPPLPKPRQQKMDEREEVYGALVLGLRDYARKNGFSGAILGLSGGVDSALVAAIAVEALGAENVWAAIMPSRYSSPETMADAKRLACNLGMRLVVLSVEPIHRAFRRELAPHLQGRESDPENLTDQNLQARIRAVYLMALSNHLGLLVLNTSNKSEAAVGYGTLYGDMVGGFAVIKDVFKTQVWELARYVNQRRGCEAIPQTIIDRIPTAELRPNQEDRQSIPDYPLLDPILELYIERDMTYAEIVAAGHAEEIVRRAIALVDRNEFKRRQAVLGTRISTKAFGKDRRLPVTNRFRQW